MLRCGTRYFFALIFVGEKDKAKAKAKDPKKKPLRAPALEML